MSAFDLTELLAWARTKPTDERYCYNDDGLCAIAQFLKDTGRAARPRVGSSWWSDLDDCGSSDLPEWANAAASANCNESAWTFGAFVERLEKVSADQLVMA